MNISILGTAIKLNYLNEFLIIRGCYVWSQ